MRIGFDARMITHPGIGRYISSLLPELIRQAPDDKFVLFGDPERLKDISRSENVRVLRWDTPIYSAWEQLFALYFPMDIDFLHVPHFNIPVFLRKKMVVTIHDLIYLLFPESASSPLAKHYARIMIGSALKKASKVITVSNHTRGDLLKIFGEQYSEKIEVIHEASDKIFRKIDDKAKMADVRIRYRLAEKILLYVGSIKPHKNVATLLKVFELLKKWDTPCQLVICGKWDKKEDYLKDSLAARDIRYLGEIPTEDLVVLYNMADALVHLSLYEGFGLTVLEAMQSGTPVIVSDSSSLPEVVGKSAFVVSPYNIEEAANTVYNVLINKHLRDEMTAAGQKHVKRFSWAETARKTLKAYRSI